MDEINRIKKLAGISEKVELMAQKNNTASTAKADDVSRAMKMKKLRNRMEEREDGDINFHGLFTGVASGDISLDEKGKIAESEFGIIQALDNACKGRQISILEEESDHSWKCDECGNDGIGFMDKTCGECGASSDNFSHPREKELDEDGGNDDQSYGIKSGRRAAGSWGKPTKKYGKRLSAKMGRRDARQDAETQKNDIGNDVDIVESVNERDMFSESTMFEKDSLARIMVEMIIDEMKTGKNAVEISEELCFNIDNVKYVVEHFKKKIDEGYYRVPAIDRERYTDLSHQGLEGPFRLKSGKVVYYDPKEGKYYDRDSDIYLSHEEYEQHNSERPVRENGLPGYDEWKTASPYDNEPDERVINAALGSGKDAAMRFLQTEGKDAIAFIFDRTQEKSDRRGAIQDLRADVEGTIYNSASNDGIELSEEEVVQAAREVLSQHLRDIT